MGIVYQLYYNRKQKLERKSRMKKLKIKKKGTDRKTDGYHSKAYGRTEGSEMAD